MFHVIAPTEWAEDTAHFVIAKTQLFCERLQAITAMEKV